MVCDIESDVVLHQKLCKHGFCSRDLQEQPSRPNDTKAPEPKLESGQEFIGQAYLPTTPLKSRVGLHIRPSLKAVGYQ